MNTVTTAQKMPRFSEQDFGNDFLSSLGSKFKIGRNLDFWEQLETRVGIPDVVLIEKQYSKNICSFISGWPPIGHNMRNAEIVSVMSSRYRSVANIALRSNYDERTVKKVLSDLEALGALKTRGIGYALEKDWCVPQVDMWSIEFKLNNWKAALRQSMKYRCFSSFSMVVMPYEKKSLLLTNKTYFEVFGIGLAVYSVENKKLEYIVRPKKHTIRNNYTYLTALASLAKQELSLTVG